MVEKLCGENSVNFLGIFGSVARGEENSESDIDLLIQFDDAAKKSLFDLVHLEGELAEVLGRKVDLVTERSVSPYIREKIMKDVQPIYERA